MVPNNMTLVPIWVSWTSWEKFLDQILLVTFKKVWQSNWLNAGNATLMMLELKWTLFWCHSDTHNTMCWCSCIDIQFAHICSHHVCYRSTDHGSKPPQDEYHWHNFTKTSLQVDLFSFRNHDAAWVELDSACQCSHQWDQALTMTHHLHCSFCLFSSTHSRDFMCSCSLLFSDLMLERHGSIFFAHAYQKLLKFSTRYALKNNGNISSTNKGSTILSNAYSTATLKSSVKQNNQLEIDNDVNSCWDRFCGWVQGLCGKTLSL